ncbi:unnamed protein product [Pleuronectes platessa]|uniref:Uncharacterized protein n=1 Tax=Pleuronectes platessa TaxID=8262 RepID=A0A9N7VZZ6_PLEPL|nr:unnamed protein product [Pleuronectes platessa]
MQSSFQNMLCIFFKEGIERESLCWHLRRVEQEERRRGEPQTPCLQISLCVPLFLLANIELVKVSAARGLGQPPLAPVQQHCLSQKNRGDKAMPACASSVMKTSALVLEIRGHLDRPGLAALCHGRP